LHYLIKLCAFLVLTGCAVPVTQPETKNVAALTFDDGPSVHTDRLLDYLAHYNAKATFFPTANRLALYPNIAARIVEDGHEIANHTWSHPDLTRLNDEQIRRQITRADTELALYSEEDVFVFRPPFGSFNQRVINAVGRSPVLWDLDTSDWLSRSPSSIAQRASQAQPGDVILFHDLHRTTVDAIPETLELLKARGFSFVTYSELRQIYPEQTYRAFQ